MVTFGRAALELAEKDPQNTFTSVKRLLGRNLVELDADKTTTVLGLEPDRAATLFCPARFSTILPLHKVATSAHVNCLGGNTFLYTASLPDDASLYNTQSPSIAGNSS